MFGDQETTYIYMQRLSERVAILGMSDNEEEEVGVENNYSPPITRHPVPLYPFPGWSCPEVTSTSFLLSCILSDASLTQSVSTLPSSNEENMTNRTKKKKTTDSTITTEEISKKWYLIRKSEIKGIVVNSERPLNAQIIMRNQKKIMIREGRQIEKDYDYIFNFTRKMKTKDNNNLWRVKYEFYKNGKIYSFGTFHYKKTEKENSVIEYIYFLINVINEKIRLSPQEILEKQDEKSIIQNIIVNFNNPLLNAHIVLKDQKRLTIQEVTNTDMLRIGKGKKEDDYTFRFFNETKNATIRKIKYEFDKNDEVYSLGVFYYGKIEEENSILSYIHFLVDIMNKKGIIVI